MQKQSALRQLAFCLQTCYIIMVYLIDAGASCPSLGRVGGRGAGICVILLKRWTALAKISIWARGINIPKTLAKSGNVVYNITCVTAQCILAIHTRYALKRKVAGGMPGNFRGVCPILNRAAVIPSTVCVMLLARERRVILRSFGVMHSLVPCFSVRKPRCGFRDFLLESREHTVECRLKSLDLRYYR